MFDAVAWISLIIGIMAITVSIPVFIISLRNKKYAREDLDQIQALLTQIDEAADTALNEINKTSKLALDEIDEKYQAMLFLYNLLDEKKKELMSMESSQASAAKRKVPVAPPLSMRSPRISGNNTKHGKVHDMYKSGLPIAEIAQRLNMGQGEVKLILDLAGR